MNSFLLYVYTGSHVKEFLLPHMIDGRHHINLYAYETGYAEDMTIVLDASNGIWKVIAKDSVKVVGEKSYEKERVISPNETINLIYESKELNVKIIISVSSKDDNLFNFSKYYCQAMKEITIGRAAGNIIMYNVPSVSSKHAVITFDSNGAVIKDTNSQNGVYVNCRKITEKKLNFGDVIFIMGLKVVYFANFIAVNNPKNAVKCKIFQHVKTGFIEDDTGLTSNDDAYDYFIRSPRIEKKLLVDREEIDPPPSPKDAKAMPLILTVGPSITMGIAMLAGVAFSFSAQRNNPSALLPSIVTTVAMLLGAVLWPVFTQRYNKKNVVQEEERRLQKYRQYINDTYVRLQSKLEHNRSVFTDTYPSIETCVSRVKTADRRLWERSPRNEDFLDLRIGRGQKPFTVEISVPREGFSIEDDPLRKEMINVADQFKYITNVPISVPFARETMVGVIGERSEQINFVNSLLIQLTALHSYTETKLVFIHNKNEGNVWSFLSALPHSWAAGKSGRYIATVQDEVREIFLEISAILSERKEERSGYSPKKKSLIPHYVIFVLEPKLIENEPVIKMLMEEQENMGITLVMLYREMSMLPNQCNTIVQCAQDKSSVYYKNDPSDKMHLFEPDNARGVNMTEYAKTLAKFKEKEHFAEASLPSSVTFLGMYKAGKVEDLIIEKRWGTSESFKTLEAAVGIGSNNQAIHLNIHDKYHGPHGLIAGMTGFGKSELIQTYVLSMAVNYHPNDVSFILIDYKGGGMANCFTGLPHIAGTITNLGGNSIHRSLVSLNSELKRRQRIFEKTNVPLMDISKYQQLWKEGKVKEPLPHLVIISDEFAELKSQQPEFMRELVSAARIGRSLGVHLILATQKPAGVVDEQIWGNTSFRVCLKVLDKPDSEAMLKRPEASLITIRGRAYLQVGNDEIFEIIQTAWSGAPYFPSDKVEDAESKTILLVDNCGRILRSANAVQKLEKAADSQLTAIVEHIISYAKEENIRPLPLWLPPLEACIGLDAIENRKGGFNGKEWVKTDHLLNPAIGFYDDPSQQKQGALYVDFIQNGHLALFGMPTTGKTTFIQTLTYSLAKTYSPDVVNIYMLDFGGRNMDYFRALPHVGDIVFSDEEEKLGKLFKMINKELGVRKKLFSETGVGSLKAYLDATSSSLPAIIIILDNVASFSELYTDYDQELIHISSQGANYGIYLAMTANASGDIKYRITQNIKQNLTLQLNDKFDYVSLVGQTGGLTPDEIKGRGLVKLEYPVEYQTALALPIESEAERTAALKKAFDLMDKCWSGYRPENIPVVPEDLSLDKVAAHFSRLPRDNKLMCGYDVEEAEPIFIDFNNTPIFTVLGEERTGKTNMLMCIIKLIKKRYDWEVWVFDNKDGGLKKTSEEYNVEEYCCGSDGLDAMVNKLFEIQQEQGKDKTAPRIIVLIDDYEFFFRSITDDGLDVFEKVVANAANSSERFIISGNGAKLSSDLSGTPAYSYIFTGIKGMLLGGGMDRDVIYSVNANYQQKSVIYDAGQGYIINKSSYKIIKTPYYN